MRTVDVARAAGISVQQVRNYVDQGLLPAAERAANGYRVFTERHVEALIACRRIIAGYGWPTAGDVMRAVHRGDAATALALVDARHATLSRMRAQADATLAALELVAAQPDATEDSPRSATPLQVGEAARVVGVRVSSLRFWEHVGLLAPSRDRYNRYRLYDDDEMRRLRVIVLLRQGGHRFDAIRTVLDELTAGHPEEAVKALEHRRQTLTRASWSCAAATAAFHAYAAALLTPRASVVAGAGGAEVSRPPVHATVVRACAAPGL